MKKFSHALALPAVLLIALAATSTLITERAAGLPAQTTPAPASREDAYRANNIGVALLEQFKYKEAADSFRRALQLDPKLSLARINLAIALYNLPDAEGAQREAQVAAAAAPQAPQAPYVLGLVAKSQSRADDAAAAFQRVLKIDPSDVGANVNLGQIYSQQRKYTEAIAAFRTALAAEPYNATALYNLGTALLRAGQRDEGQQVIARFQELRQRGSGTTLGQNYLEQGRYAEAVASTGAEPELVERATPTVTFADATAAVLPAASGAQGAPSPAAPQVFGRGFKGAELNDTARREIAAALGGCATLFDSDGDGDLDLFWAGSSRQRLYRNDGGRFTDATTASGALAAKPGGAGVGAVAGDYDNDGKPDLFVVRDGGLALYRNDGGWKFSDVTAAAGIPAYPYLPGAVAFVDADHDGDLDIFVAGLADLSKAPAGGAVFPEDFAAAPNLLLRNDGTGKFTDTTAAAKLGAAGHAVAVVPTDFNNRRDIDLLVVGYGEAPALYSNLRDGTFRNVATEVGLGPRGRWTCAAAGDVNKDGFTDFFFGRADAPGLFAMSDGREKFRATEGPAAGAAASAAQFLDYDDDGLLDLVVLADGGVRVWRNVGDAWADVSERAAAGGLAGAGRLFAAGDADGDGDADLFALSPTGELRFARNDGGNANHSLRVSLTGKVSNRSGVGAKIEARAGSLVQKLETYSASPAPAPADTIFGLGRRGAADAVRVLWPAGVVQAETEITKAQVGGAVASKSPSAATLPVTELDRKPSSCPYLYAWNGRSFEFITDFMGGGEMGYLEEPGRYNKPDPTEYVRIRGDQLRERDGRYELRVTNELEEALFADRFQLIAVAHPAGTEVYPNEGMTDPPRPYVLYKTRGAHPPAAAADDHGRDVLARVTRMDRLYPDDFRRDPVRGYAERHTLTLKLDGGAPANRRTLLLLTGWTDYAWSSDNVAAAQAGKTMLLPALQVRDARGEWKTVIEDIGIPVGRPQTVTVDLTGKFLTASREVRLVTSMRILWDQILVDTSAGDSPARVTRLDPASATLRWRGFSRETTPDGREPYGYDYSQVSYASPWKAMPGRYTREGDVRELLLAADDMFVISRPGDEISLSFDARRLPPLPAGWTRTFLLCADGFSKEMDINSASPDQVLPLPFHGMTKYPYGEREAYPMTAARRAYVERYNTRLVRSEVPSIDSVLVDTRGDGAARVGGGATQSGGRR
ncbi:MAG TPA: FG-GAP-like repeat-containing protein [Pyrinomonadaceae bacterium]|jgi:tetratricopeptide (TPR) repeat protein|nr:FG-GAP-like repeat-containing protein [Pyrinomonadaceae bacterium]